MNKKQRTTLAYSASIVLNGGLWLAYGHALRLTGSQSAAPHEHLLHVTKIDLYHPAPPRPQLINIKPALASSGKPSTDQSEVASSSQTASDSKAAAGGSDQDASSSGDRGSEQSGGKSGHTKSISNSEATASNSNDQSSGAANAGSASTKEASNDITSHGTSSQSGSLSRRSGHSGSEKAAQGKSSTGEGDSHDASAAASHSLSTQTSTHLAELSQGDHQASAKNKSGRTMLGHTANAHSHADRTASASSAKLNGMSALEASNDDSNGPESPDQQTPDDQQKQPDAPIEKTLTLHVIKMWAPEPGQKINLATNLKIIIPPDVQVIPGKPLTEEQVEEVRKLLAQQTLHHVDMDKDVLRKLLAALRMAQSQPQDPPPTPPAPRGDTGRNRKHDQQAGNHNKQSGKKPNPSIKEATKTLPRPVSPYQFRPWNTDMYRRWAPTTNQNASVPDGQNQTSPDMQASNTGQSGKLQIPGAPGSPNNQNGMTEQPGAGDQNGAGGQQGMAGQPGAGRQQGMAGQPGAGGQQGMAGQPGAGGQQGMAGQPSAGGQQGMAGQPGAGGQQGMAGQPGAGGQQDMAGQPDAGGQQGMAGQPGAGGQQGMAGQPGAGGQQGMAGQPGAGGQQGMAGQRGAGGQQGMAGQGQGQGQGQGMAGQGQGQGQGQGMAGQGQGQGQGQGMAGQGQGQGQGQGMAGQGQGQGQGQGMAGQGQGQGQGQGMAGQGQGQGQGQGMAGQGQGQGQGQGMAGQGQGQGTAGQGGTGGAGGMLAAEQSGIDGIDGDNPDITALEGRQDNGLTDANEASAPDLPMDSHGGKKGIPGALVLPPAPPEGTDQGRNPIFHAIRHVFLQLASGILGTGTQDSPEQTRVKVSGTPNRTSKKPVPTPLSVGSTSTHGDVAITVASIRPRQNGTKSFTSAPPMPKVPGATHPSAGRPQPHNPQLASTYNKREQNAPITVELIQTANNSHGMKVGTDSPLPPTPMPDSDMQVGDGSGLKGDYYIGRRFNQFVFSRADANINFQFDQLPGRSPSPRITPGSEYTVRWTGKIAAKYSETYTLYATVDDGIRVWIDHKLVVDDWTDHSPTQFSNRFTFVAGHQYDLKVEYLEIDGGQASVRLYWESPSQQREFIPEDSLFYPLPLDEADMKKDKAPL